MRDRSLGYEVGGMAEADLLMGMEQVYATTTGGSPHYPYYDSAADLLHLFHHLSGDVSFEKVDGSCPRVGGAHYYPEAYVVNPVVAALLQRLDYPHPGR